MKCPDCNEIITKVIDSRLTEKGYTIRRRRECESCSHRFTTYEYVFPKKIVIKKKKINFINLVNKFLNIIMTLKKYIF